MNDSSLEPRSRSVRAARLLLIDDNPHDRELLARELRQWFVPLTIESIREQAEFERALAQADFDAVVVDYQIRWSTGLEVLRAVKRARPQCPVLMFTASGNEEIAVEAMKQGLDDYVTKTAKHYARLPFCLQAALERTAHRQELEHSERAKRALIEQLAQSQQRMQMALHAARMMAWEFDPTDERLTVSADAQAIVGQHWRSLSDLLSSLHPADIPTLKQLVERAKDTGKCFTTEVRVRGGPLQDEVWLELRGQPASNSTGEPGRLIGVATDISEQRRDRAAAAQLATIVESSQDAIVSHTLEGIVTSWNAAATHLYGYTAAEMIGQSVTHIIPPELRPEAERILARLRAGERIDNHESVRISKDGRQIAVSITVSPVLGPDGTIVGASKITRDITERKRAEEELRAADRRKDAFVAMLAHELRNPLAPIRYATRLLKPGVPAEMAEDARRMIDRQLAHMARLLDDLLDVSRISRGALEVNCETLDLREVIESAVAVARPLAEAAQLSLAVKLHPSALLVTADATRMGQVLGNILNNATKYSRPGGHISVTSELDDSDVIVRVRDDGVGIAPDLLPRIFDLFVQAEPRGARAAGGLGIGLSLARDLVHLHGGQIQATSEGSDRGSEFVVRLPRAAELPAIKQAVAQAEKVTVLGAARVSVLIIDDNADAADALSEVLTLVGYQTHVAYRGIEALAIAASQHPDVVLLDIGLPDLSGHEIARRLRAEPWGASLYLVAITGWGREDDRRKTHDVGFDEHLTKPVDPELLIGLIARWKRNVA